MSIAEGRWLPSTTYIVIVREGQYMDVLEKLQIYFGSDLLEAHILNSNTARQDNGYRIEISVAGITDTQSIARVTRLLYDEVIVKTEEYVSVPQKCYSNQKLVDCNSMKEL